MKTAAEIYADYSYFGDYQPMLDSFGEILIQEDDDDYQGDSYVLYKDGSRYGLLIFGWGSCSGCDALQACNSIKEVQELMDSLYSDIEWFEDLPSLQVALRLRDLEGQYWYHTHKGPTFAKKVLEFVDCSN